MRRTWRWMVLALAIGCGAGGVPGCCGAGGGNGGSGSGSGIGSGNDDAAVCSDLRSQFNDLVEANRSCTVDADCVWVPDGCFADTPCTTFVNGSVAAELATFEQQGSQACASCVQCMALLAACNHGTCGQKEP